MGMLRTIQHPAVEVQEVDMSGTAEQVGGCTSLVMGFFPQGESGKPVNPTSLASVKSYFGTPENEAERYGYYACKTVFDNGGKLIAARIPYNNNSQYLTPAVKYNIEEWSTKHTKTFNSSNGYEIKNRQTANYNSFELDNTTNPEKFQFYYNPDSPNLMIETVSAFDYKTTEGTLVPKNVTAISTNSIKSDAYNYYELTYNDFAVASSWGDRTVTVTVCSFNKEDEPIIKGTVQTYAALEGIEAQIGDVYKVVEAHGTYPANSNYQFTNIEYETNVETVAALDTIKETVKHYTYDCACWAGYIVTDEHEDVADYDALQALTDVQNGDLYRVIDDSTNNHGHFAVYKAIVAGSTVNWNYVSKGGKKVDEDNVVSTYSNLPEYEEGVDNGAVYRVESAYSTYAANSNYVAVVDEENERVSWEFASETEHYYKFDRSTETWSSYFGKVDVWLYKQPAGYTNFSYGIVDSASLFNASQIDVLINASVWRNSTATASITSYLNGSIHLSSDGFEHDFSPLFQSKTISSGMDCSFLKEENAKYFNILKSEFKKWNSNIEQVGGNYFYNETLCADNKSNFYYEPTQSSPVTAFVDAYTSTGTKKVVAIKNYYESGEGIKYPECDTEDYLELRVWDSSVITGLSSLTQANSDSFDIVHRKYIGTLVSETSRITNKDFKTVPVSTDVTVGYYPTGSEITSDTLAIPAADVWNETNYPVIENMNPFGTGYMKVLKKIRPNRSDAYNQNDFYQFVSPYTSIKDVALAHSEKYNWIHWVTSSATEEVTGNNVLLSRTLGCKIEDVPVQLSEVENIVSIVPDVDGTGYIPLQDYQDYRDEAKTPSKNTIVIANITEQKFGSDTYNNSVSTDSDSSSADYSDEVLGIVPVLMGGFQALPRQSRIELPDGITNSHIFNAIEAIKRGCSIENDPAPAADHVDVKSVTLNGNGFVRTLGTSGEYDAYESTYSNSVLANVPSIELNANYKPNGSKTNYVTLAVCKLSLSKVNDNKIALTVLETFTGSLDKTAKDDKGNSLFIDNVVNNEDNGSTYVKMFSNYESDLNGSKSVTQSKREVVKPASNDTKITLTSPASFGKTLWWTGLKPSMSLGFTNEQTKKYISYATIVATMENVFDTLSNVDEIDVDIVVDAGLSTIANRVKKYCDENPEKTKCLYDVFFDKINSVNDIGGWKSICSKLLTFCQTTRKDCIALVDAPRSLCVKDNVKLVQPGGKYSIDYDILPKFNYLGGLNSSYIAGYCDWFLAVDDFSSKNVWIPPSIAAEGSVIYTDYNSNYWMAPAGANRGNVTWAVDIAFNPSAAQQDSIYTKNWNYAISSSGNIMVWGQKTMLSSTSSFNRINIRRLFCKLERMTRKNSKWVIFELNNERTRNIYKDRIDPIFANVKAMGGIYDYQIICDTRTNTPNVIQNNEFRAAFLIKPEITAEYIVLTFFNLNQDMDFTEAYSQL